MSDATLVDTNSIKDSKGEVFGLPGNMYLWIMIPLFITLLASSALCSFLKVNAIASIIVMSPSTILSTVYVLCLKKGKPEGYDRDFFEKILRKEAWTMDRIQPQHPKLSEK